MDLWTAGLSFHGSKMGTPISQHRTWVIGTDKQQALGQQQSNPQHSQDLRMGRVF